MKPQLLITTDGFLPHVDGVAIYLKNILPALAKRFDITVIAPKFKGKIPPLPARIIQIPLGIKISDTWIALFQYRRIKELICECDVVFNHSIGTIGAAAILAAHKLKKPIVTQIHSYDWELFSLSVAKFKHLIRWLTVHFARYLYNRSTSIMYPSAEVQHVYQNKGIRAPSQVIDIGIPSKLFSTPRASHHGLVIGYCGRIAREKGLTFLLKAYTSVKKTYRNLRLMIVGDGLRTLKWRAKLAGAELKGQVSNPQDYYSQMDIFVLPSLTETTSLSTMEAMSAGLPIVASSVGRLPEFMRSSKGGIIVPPGDEAALESALRRLIEDPALRQKMGSSARTYALKRFDIEKSAKKVVALLLTALKTSNSRPLRSHVRS